MAAHATHKILARVSRQSKVDVGDVIVTKPDTAFMHDMYPQIIDFFSDICQKAGVPRCLRQLLVIFSVALLSATAIAADRYPVRPVRVVVGYAPGGGNDILARLLGQKLGERLGQTFVVDTRPGAASLLGTTIVAKAQGDGYTLILSDIPLVLNVAISAKPPYDAIKDFSPIMRLATAPQVLVAHPSFEANSIKELIAMPRARTEKFALGTSGLGSLAHVANELLRLKTGLVLNHVPYKGAGPAITDVVAGQIPLAFAGAPPIVPYIKGNLLKGIGVTAATRHPLLPGVPTFEEAGVKDFVVLNWYGVLASGGTPPAVVKLLYQEIVRALELPDVKARFASLALDMAPLGPDEFRKFIESDVTRWKDVAAKSGIKFE